MAAVPSPAQAVLQAIEKRSNPCRTQVVDEASIMAATFDDGPHPSGTRAVMNVLHRYQSKGTFFVLGPEVMRYRSIAREIVDSGHEIGLHGWHHERMDLMSWRAIHRAIVQAKEAVEDVCGVPVRFLRPPYGLVTPAVADVAATLGLTIAGWNANSDDWREPAVAESITALAVGGVRGKVVLFHDGSGDPGVTSRVLTWLLRTAGKSGVKPLTLSEYAAVNCLPDWPIHEPSLFPAIDNF
jgi:peptidoglycan/xylan/chitin deacetylase (PgdA/CDA1 family)